MVGCVLGQTDLHVLLGVLRFDVHASTGGAGFMLGEEFGADAVGLEAVDYDYEGGDRRSGKHDYEKDFADGPCEGAGAGGWCRPGAEYGDEDEVCDGAE